MTDLIEQQTEDQAQRDTLTQGRAAAQVAADYWRTAADTLTMLRANAARHHLPATPDGHELWFESRRIALPFTDISLEYELNHLSDLIAQAHTIAVLYSEEADRLDAELAEVNRPRGIYTDEQRAAALEFVATITKVDAHAEAEPTYFTAAWAEWQDDHDAYEAERADARTAYVALFDGDAPDPRDLLAR